MSKIMSSLLLAGAMAAMAPLAADAAEHSCDGLRSLERSDLKITRVVAVKKGSQPASDAARAALTGAAASNNALPAYCEVEATIAPRTGAENKPYGIKIQLRMPEGWNGRFLYQGGGGMDGVVNEALGATPISGSTALPALSRGYAVVSTDSGHQGASIADASFAVDQQARLDYAYAAIGTVTRIARSFITAYYAKPVRRSFFMGCSNGGREALMAAQRFPNDFDGIVAANPGFRLSRAAIAQAWDTQAFTKVAPLDANGNPILAKALTPADMTLVKNAVLESCDATDGLKDGAIEAMGQCHFDPSVLQCDGGKTDQCLTGDQVTALKTVFGGAHDSQGHAIYSTWPYDAGIDTPPWRAWKLGFSEKTPNDALNATLGVGSLGTYFQTPPVPGFSPAALDYDRVVAATAQTAAINDATSTMMSTFVARGGKLLVVHGNSDPVFSADDLRAYWQDLSKDNGGSAALSQWARLFIVPGMTHCGGGTALDDIDPLSALEAWVDGGQAPAALSAKGKAFPGRSRPVCPYPQEAFYRGSGDPQAEASFECR